MDTDSEGSCCVVLRAPTSGLCPVEPDWSPDLFLLFAWSSLVCCALIAAGVLASVLAIVIWAWAKCCEVS